MATSSAEAAHQRLAGANAHPLAQAIAEVEAAGGEHDDRRSMLEPAEFVALGHADVARKHRCSRRSRLQNNVEEMQPNARDQHGSDRHKRERLAGGESAAKHGALVLAKELLDPLQRDRVDVPAIAE